VPLSPEASVVRERQDRGARRLQVPSHEEPTVARYLWTVVEGWRTILVVLAFALVAGAFYLLSLIHI